MANILSRFEEKEETIETTEKYLTFIVDKQHYAYPIRCIKEIIEIQDIAEVPEFPSYAKGIINLRGMVVPVIDVRLRFFKPEVEYNERTCIIVLTIKNVEIGFIVDTVEEVIDIDDKDISSAPRIGGKANAKYIEGIGKIGSKIILLLNAEKMIDDDMTSFEAYSQLSDGDTDKTAECS